jgi:hypothetical protein
MSVEKAKNNFLGKNNKRLNCYQAIIDAFQDKFKIPEQEINDGKIFGGGRAPDGFCGALYAVKVILEKNNGDITELMTDFMINDGGYRCADIRSARQTSCVECIEKAAQYLSSINS